MTPGTHQRRRLVLSAAFVAFAILGLTACDADHYYGIFGKPPDFNMGPGCGAFCVSSGSVIQPNGEFDVEQGDIVRFYNLTESTHPGGTTTVVVTLTYEFPDGTAGLETLTIREGKSKKLKIKRNLPVATEIEMRYTVDDSPPHGGPTMIVQPTQPD